MNNNLFYYLVRILVDYAVLEALIQELYYGLLHPAVTKVLDTRLPLADLVVHVTLVDCRYPLESAGGYEVRGS